MKTKLLLCLALVLGGYCHAAIVYPKEPAGGREMALQFASDIVGKDVSPFKEISITNELTFAHALPNYHAGDLTKGRLLTGAESSWKGSQGWTYVFLHGTNVVGDAFVEADDKAKKATACLAVGNAGFAKASLKALQEAEQWPQVQRQDFEARLLDDTCVSFEAVWLHGQSNDIIIPLPAYNRFHAYQPYSESEIIKILEPEAKREKAMGAKLDKQRKENYNAYTKAMIDYEKMHGGKCGTITLYGMGPRIEPIQTVDGRPVWVEILKGKSSNCAILAYKARVTYTEKYNVKRVEILEKVEDNNP